MDAADLVHAACLEAGPKRAINAMSRKALFSAFASRGARFHEGRLESLLRRTDDRVHRRADVAQLLQIRFKHSHVYGRRVQRVVNPRNSTKEARTAFCVLLHADVDSLQPIQAILARLFGRFITAASVDCVLVDEQ